tara:strand:- start:247 stop:918 length:672 start_codon:yes stop_codon:yes gene_type:complete
MLKVLQKTTSHIFQILFVLVGVWAISLQFNSCGSKKELWGSQQANLRLIEQGQNMAITITEQGKETAFQEALYFSEKSKNESLIERITQLESVSSRVEATTVTRIDSIIIEVNRVDTLVLDGDSLTNHFFHKVDEHFSLSGHYNSRLIYIDSLLIPNRFVITHLWKRKNFLAKKEYLVEVENENPYVHTLGLNNYSFRESKKWHEKRGVMIGFGLVAGYFLFK